MPKKVLKGSQISIGVEKLSGHGVVKTMAGDIESGFSCIGFHPLLEASHRTAMEALYALGSDYGISERDPGPCSLGVDQGKNLHVVVGRTHPDRAGKILYLAVPQEWSDLERIIRDFNVLLKSLGKDTIYPGVEVPKKILTEP